MNKIKRPVVVQRHKSVIVKLTGCGFDSDSTKWNIYSHLYYIHFLALVRARLCAPLNTRLQNSAASGKRSVLALGSLCLPCCVRNTAWSWFIYFIWFFKFLQVFKTLASSYHIQRTKEIYYTILASRFILSGVVRENGAPNATVSTYLFRLVHCHQRLYTHSSYIHIHFIVNY